MSESSASVLPTFRDHTLEGRFRRLGAVVVPFLDEAAVTRVGSHLLAAYPDSTDPFFTTALEGDRNQPRTWARPIMDELVSIAERMFVDHIVRDVYLLVKRPVGPAEAGGRVPLHQDWTFVDERQTRGVLIWCPMVDVDEENAALVVVPGSHRLELGPRGAPPLENNLDAVIDELREHQVMVPIPRGHAVIYDGALVHASEPNRGAELRPVLGVGVTHRQATHLTYHQVPGVGPVAFEVEPNHFVTADLLVPPTRGVRGSVQVACDDLGQVGSLAPDARAMLEAAHLEFVGSNIPTAASGN